MSIYIRRLVFPTKYRYQLSMFGCEISVALVHFAMTCGHLFNNLVLLCVHMHTYMYDEINNLYKQAIHRFGENVKTVAKILSFKITT